MYLDNQKPNKYFVIGLLVISLLALFFTLPKVVDKNIIVGQVVRIENERFEKTINNEEIKIQELIVSINENNKPKEIKIINDLLPVNEGGKIFLRLSIFEDNLHYEMVDLNRNYGLGVLFTLFIFLVIITGGWKGFYSLISLIISFSIIISFIIPQILAGHNPILIGIAGAISILLISLYLSYGLNKKSLSALIGISITLIFVGLLGKYTIELLRFSGLSNEEAVFLNASRVNPLNIIGLLMAGIIIAAIGVIDDVAVTQSSTVFNLQELNPEINKKELFRRAMVVGRDHISAVVNTLVLAYTGASLPLILLLSAQNTPWKYFISNEIIAEEIVRTLVASSGLLLAVPVTTLVAVYLAKK
jgi:uncharacterized membrane protein